MNVTIEGIDVQKDNDVQLIIGQAGFIKTAEDLYEVMMDSSPSIKFGIAFTEASGDCLVRSEGNDEDLVHMAEKNAIAINAGHTFYIFFKNAYPINVNPAIKDVPEVATLFCSTANRVTVIVADTSACRAIVGIADGEKARGIETEEDKKKRREFIRKIGYKLS